VQINLGANSRIATNLQSQVVSICVRQSDRRSAWEGGGAAGYRRGSWVRGGTALGAGLVAAKR